MYIEFGSKVVDSNEMKNLIESKSEFKVLKDMSKGSKREDVLAFNLSIDVNTLKESIEEDYDIFNLNEDEQFDEFLTMAEEFATDLEEYLPEEAILDIRSYKWDQSDNDIKLVLVVAHQELGKPKLMDVMKWLLTQVE